MKKFPLIILIMTLAFSIIPCKSRGELKCNIKPTATPNIKFYPAENTIQIKGIQRAAILPFADYSAQQEPIAYREWGGNIKIMEEIIDQLTMHGISVVIQEDINSLLVDNELIKPIDKEKYLIYGTLEDGTGIENDIISPKYELQNFEHSEAMQEELTKLIGEEKKEANENPPSPILQGASVGISKDKIIEIGQILGADIIFRGRIIEYGYKDIGKKRSAVVQIRIYAQETSSGDMVWTNRAEIEYTPDSKEESHPKVMFDKAVKKGIEELMGSFFSNTSTPAAAL